MEDEFLKALQLQQLTENHLRMFIRLFSTHLCNIYIYFGGFSLFLHDNSRQLLVKSHHGKKQYNKFQ